MSLQCYVLEKTTRKEKKQNPPSTSVTRKYSNLKNTNLKFEDLRPLHDLWLQYMDSIVNGTETKDDRLLKADYHGCMMLVARSTNKSQTGISGFVVRETKNAFILINRKDKFLTIPKQGSQFQFVIKDKVFTIFGDNFRSTSAGRIQKKFKNMTVPEFLSAK